MSVVLCEKSDIVAIADKIRAANGTTAKMTMQEIIDNCGGSSSGGAKVETCTVVITSKLVEEFWATCYADGEFYVVDISRMPMPLYDAPGEGRVKTYVIENVVKYAVLPISISIPTDNEIVGDGFQDVTYVDSIHKVFVITAGDGATVEINIA